MARATRKAITGTTRPELQFATKPIAPVRGLKDEWGHRTPADRRIAATG